MKRAGGLYRQIPTYENLCLAFWKAARGNGSNSTRSIGPRCTRPRDRLRGRRRHGRPAKHPARSLTAKRSSRPPAIRPRPG